MAGLAFASSLPNTLVGFGGLTGSLLAENAQAIAMIGLLWGIARLIAAWGCWSLRKWGLALGIIVSAATMVAAITIIPAGMTDTLLAMPALILLLYAWFGGKIKEIV
jgi:uncharacterized membrane protein (DUF2068 family)